MKTKGKTLYLVSSINPAGWMKPSLNRTSTASANGTRTTATSTSRSRRSGANGRKGKMTIVVVIVEGPQYHVGKLIVTGTK